MKATIKIPDRVASGGEGLPVVNADHEGGRDDDDGDEEWEHEVAEDDRVDRVVELHAHVHDPDGGRQHKEGQIFRGLE
jgi:hypothetical protein